MARPYRLAKGKFRRRGRSVRAACARFSPEAVMRTTKIAPVRRHLARATYEVALESDEPSDNRRPKAQPALARYRASAAERTPRRSTAGNAYASSGLVEDPNDGWSRYPPQSPCR